MKWLFQPLLLLLVRSTDSELARMVEFLKAENGMLRRRINKRIRLKAQEKRLLVKLGEAVGSGVGVLLTMVSYPTYRRYVNQVGSPDPDLKKNAPKRKLGRPPTPQHVRELVLKLARENDWGYTRILGELKKLGIRTSRSNVVNILRQNDLDPKTDPGKGRGLSSSRPTRRRCGSATFSQSTSSRRRGFASALSWRSPRQRPHRHPATAPKPLPPARGQGAR